MLKKIIIKSYLFQHMIVLILSPLISPSPSRSRPSNLQDKPNLSTRRQDQDELATRIEQQRVKIRVLNLTAKERKRAD